MKNPVKHLLLLPVLLILGGCSWIHEYVLVNKSGRELNVSYQLTTISGEGIFDTVPKLINGTQRDTLNYRFDPLTKTVRFKIPAGKEVVIGHDLNATFKGYQNDPFRFNLNTITTNGSDKLLSASEIIRRTVSKKAGKAELELR